MTDLAAFLAARQDEDEARAKGRQRAGLLGEFLDEDSGCVVTAARLLREVEAKRAILASYEGSPGFDLPEGVREGRDLDERLRDEAIRDELEDVVMTLASVYSDHPDYDPAWG